MDKIYTSTSLEWRPSPVVALAASPDGSQVAAAREDNSLEVWLVSPGSVGWHCQLTIQGHVGSRVTSLVWCSPGAKEKGLGRLLSSSLDGSVSEWDLYALKQKIVLDSVGVSIWQMAVEPPTEVVQCAKQNSQLVANGHVNGDFESDSQSCQSDSSDDDDDDLDDKHPSPSKQENQRLAIACNDGCIHMYTVSASNALSFTRTFARISGRALSLAWSLDGKFLFCGSSDGLIRCWDSRTAVESYRITVGLGGLGSKSELCVWSLLFLRCGTLVSADSTGSVQFWDSSFGTLLQAHSYHQGDAIALAASPNHRRVFSAGSDGQVILYKMCEEIESSSTDDPYSEALIKWAYIGYKRSHSHDIRALVVAVPISSEVTSLPDEKPTRRPRLEKGIKYNYHKWANLGVPMLLSAGDDTKIFAYSVTEFTKFSPHDICPAPQRVPVHLTISNATDGPVILAQSPGCIDISAVQLGGTAQFGKCAGGHATTRLVAKIKSKGSKKIISSAISKSGVLFAYSDNRRSRIFQLGSNKAKNSRTVIELKPHEELPPLPCAHSMVFCADSSRIIISAPDGKIHVVNVEKLEILITLKPLGKENAASGCAYDREPPITKMFVSSDSQWLAAVNCFGDIYIFNLDLNRQHWFISRMNGASVTAGGFPPKNCNVLVITTSVNEVYVFDVEARTLGKWSRHHTFMLPRRFQEFPGEVIGMSFPPSSSTSVIVYSARAMCFIDFGMPLDRDGSDIANGIHEKSHNPASATLKKKRKNSEFGPPLGNFDFLGFKDPVMFVGHLSEKTLLVLQKPWLEIVSTFEAPVHRHIYGT